MATQELEFAIVDDDAPRHLIQMSVESVAVETATSEQLNITVPTAAPRIMAGIFLMSWQSLNSTVPVTRSAATPDVVMVLLTRDGVVVQTVAAPIGQFTVGSSLRDRWAFQNGIRLPGSKILPGDIFTLYWPIIETHSTNVARITTDLTVLALDR